MYVLGDKLTVLYCYTLLSFLSRGVCGSDNENNIFEYIDQKNCAKNEYFDTNSWKCIRCASTSVSSADGLGCVCDENSKTIVVKSGNRICEKCENGKIVTTDGYECITCRNSTNCGCSENEIRIERSWNGSFLDTLQCLPCPENTYPSSDGTRCLPCDHFNPEDDGNCPYSFARTNEKLLKFCRTYNVVSNWSDVRNTYYNRFKNLNLDSYYFRTELRSTMDSCEKGDQRSCRHLANMCALTLFDESNIACKLFLHKKYNKPTKLFYRDGETQTILSERTISQRYTLDRDDPNSRLQLRLATFALRGELETIGEPILSCPYFVNPRFGVNMQKNCKISAIELLNEKMEFFVPYLLYSDGNSSIRLLHALPIVVKNSGDSEKKNYAKTRLVRTFFSIDKITGYRAISTSLKNSSFTRAPKLEVLRYVKSLQLVVKLQERNKLGKIFPPLVIVDYDELTYEEMQRNVEVTVEYKITYSFDDDETNVGIEVSMAVFSLIAVAFAAIKTWSDCRRNDKTLFSVAATTWFVVYSLGSVGNAFLAISSIACIYTMIFYKGQKVVHILLPSDENESIIKICTILAFAFKIVEILGLIYHHRRFNIFFIDWEQPRINESKQVKYDSPRTSLRKSYAGRFTAETGRNAMQSASESISARRNKNSSSRSSQASSTPSRLSSSGMQDPATSGTTESIVNDYNTTDVCLETIFSINDSNVSTNNCSVSIWRTCVVANEWLKLKTKRRVNVMLQMLTTIFILEIIGVKQWSMAVPEWSLEREKMSTVQRSFTLQYAVGSLVYTMIYFAQWWLTVFIYEKYVKNQLQEFIDLCSMANISVFILSHDYYGYYIHGRSVHGFADTDLLTLINDLKREENNLCAHRGLVPGTTEQTFVISVSKTFRTFYDVLSGSQNSYDGKFLRRYVSKTSDWNVRWQTHLKLRKFLTGFLDHCYKNVDYTVKERHLLEKLCDVDLLDVNEKSIFYIDNNYTFNRTMFYGNEWSLATFEITVFVFVLVIGGNYIVASVVTALTAKAVNFLARFRGKRILANKMLIDERFLLS